MYHPHRDDRFEYLSEVMDLVEQSQCISCAFRDPHGDNVYGEPYLMCSSIESLLTLDRPVEELDDLGDVGIVCNKYLRSKNE